jgi:site-specific recombinase XerD
MNNEQHFDLENLLDIYFIERLLSPASIETYKKVVSRWITETGTRELRALDRDEVIVWRNKILSRARPETWNKYRRHMRALVNYGIERGWTDKNPFSEVPPARTGMRLKKTVDVEIVRHALRILSDPQCERLQPTWFWAIVVRAIYYTGVRRRQIVEMLWDDVILDQAVWRIRAETCKNRREWFVPLNPVVVEDLRELHRRTSALLKKEPDKHDQVYNVTLFYDRYFGPQMSGDQIGGFFQRLSAIAEARITPHRLRHTLATLLAASGDIRTLQELLGHTNVSTTMGYIHPDIERMRGLISSLPAV